MCFRGGSEKNKQETLVSDTLCFFLGKMTGRVRDTNGYSDTEAHTHIHAHMHTQRGRHLLWYYLNPIPVIPSKPKISYLMLLLLVPKLLAYSCISILLFSLLHPLKTHAECEKEKNVVGGKYRQLLPFHCW